MQERRGWRAYRRRRFGNEWRENPDILAEEEEEEETLAKAQEGLKSGGGSAASFFSLLHLLLPPLVPPPISLAQMLRRVLVQLHWRPWWHEIRNWPL